MCISDVCVCVELFQLCFAHKGVLLDYIWLTYSYKDASTEVTETRTDRYSYTFEKDSDTE